LGALASLANVVPYNYGVNEFIQRDSGIYISVYENHTRVWYRSIDGGLTWEGAQNPTPTTYTLPSPATIEGEWLIPDSADAQIVYRIERGQSVERSTDGGRTWMQEFDLLSLVTQERRTYYYRVHENDGQIRFASYPLDTVFDPGSGNLVLAMGLDGVLVRTPDGVWQWVTVSSYRRVEITTLRTIYHELWLGLLLIPIVFSGLFALRFQPPEPLRAFMLIGLQILWVGWLLLVPLLFSPDVYMTLNGDLAAGDNAGTLVWVLAPMVFASGISLLVNARHMVDHKRDLLPTLLIAIGAALAYVGMCFLWAQQIIVDYPVAQRLGVLAAVLIGVGGFWYFGQLRYGIGTGISALSFMMVPVVGSLFPTSSCLEGGGLMITGLMVGVILLDKHSHPWSTTPRPVSDLPPLRIYPGSTEAKNDSNTESTSGEETR
jgi:hypothetical protein